MPVRTNPRQPVVYDMMLLVYALVRLDAFEKRRVGRHHPDYCERQTVFENACTKVRGLSQFISATGGKDLLKITDSEFGGVADKRFLTSYFDVISKFVSHLHEERWRKSSRHPRPRARDVLVGGREILDYLKPLLGRLKPNLAGDAARWYGVFEGLYQQLTNAGVGR